MAGEIIHIELPSRDFTRSAAFYAKLFGWTTDGAQSGGHLFFDSPGGVQGSWIRDALAQAPGPVPFVAVDDVDKTLAEAEKQGGRILVRRLTLPNRGQFGLFSDCDGNVVAILAGRGDSAKEAVPTTIKVGNKSGATGSAKAADPASKPDKPDKKVSSKQDSKLGRQPAAPGTGGASRAKKPPTRKR